MTNLQPLDLQTPDDAIGTDDEHSSAHQTAYATAYIEREANEACRLRGLTPEKRAKAAWARLRVANVEPYALLAAMLAVELVILNDPQAERKQNFKLVQVA